MSQNINLSNAEINKDYVVTEIKSNKERLKNFGIYVGAPIIPLYKSMGKNICAYKTNYGIFAIRNETARSISVQNECW